MKGFKAVAVYWLLAGVLALPMSSHAALPELVGIIKQVSPSVVNINTTQKVHAPESGASPQAPEGTPFDDLLKRFFETPLTFVLAITLRSRLSWWDWTSAPMLLY